jgi:hypothetical protein
MKRKLALLYWMWEEQIHNMMGQIVSTVMILQTRDATGSPATTYSLEQ